LVYRRGNNKILQYEDDDDGEHISNPAQNRVSNSPKITAAAAAVLAAATAYN
jgi:hypothetical protein